MTGMKKLTERSSESKCIFLDRKQVTFKLRYSKMKTFWK